MAAIIFAPGTARIAGFVNSFLYITFFRHFRIVSACNLFQLRRQVENFLLQQLARKSLVADRTLERGDAFFHR